MSLPQALLGLLEPRPAHGYSLKQEYDLRFGARRPVKAPQVYATLGRLLRDGQVTVVGTDREAGPDRTHYALTADGVTSLEQWLAEPESDHPFAQSAVFIKVALALQSGRDARAILRSQREHHVEVMRGLTREKGTADLPQVIALDYTLFHLQADLDWLEHTASRLELLADALGQTAAGS